MRDKPKEFLRTWRKKLQISVFVLFFTDWPFAHTYPLKMVTQYARVAIFQNIFYVFSYGGLKTDVFVNGEVTRSNSTAIVSISSSFPETALPLSSFFRCAGSGNKIAIVFEKVRFRKPFSSDILWMAGKDRKKKS